MLLAVILLDAQMTNCQPKFGTCMYGRCISAWVGAIHQYVRKNESVLFYHAHIRMHTYTNSHFGPLAMFEPLRSVPLPEVRPGRKRKADDESKQIVVLTGSPPYVRAMGFLDVELVELLPADLTPDLEAEVCSLMQAKTRLQGSEAVTDKWESPVFMATYGGGWFRDYVDASGYSKGREDKFHHGSHVGEVLSKEVSE